MANGETLNSIDVTEVSSFNRSSRSFSVWLLHPQDSLILHDDFIFENCQNMELPRQECTVAGFQEDPVFDPAARHFIPEVHGCQDF